MLNRKNLYTVNQDLIQSLPKCRKNRFGYKNEYERINHKNLFSKCCNMFGPIFEE